MPETRSAAFPTLTRALAKVPAERRSAAVRVGLAVAIAALLTCLAIVAVWGPFDARTDVVGYPAFAAFNVANYLHAYYLVVGFFPLAALAIFAALTKLAPRIGLASPPPGGPLRPGHAPPEPAKPLVADPPADSLSGSRQSAVRAARTGFLGAVLGLEAGIAADSIWAGLLIGTAAYSLLALLAAAALARTRLRDWPRESRRAMVNSLAAPLAVAGLVAVSAATAVHVGANGRTVDYAWFPVWMALPVTAAMLGAVAVALRRAGTAQRVLVVERTVLLLIAAPVALFALSATLHGDAPGVYGDSGATDLFHSGEQLVGARLISDGWLPWRDVVLTHGVLSDVFGPIVGHAIFGDSRWGNIAGLTVLLHPLYLLGFYFLCVYLFGRNWLFLLFTGLLAVGTALGPELTSLYGENFRFLLWPLVLLLLAATLNRPTAGRATGLALLSVGQAIVTPEAGPALLAVAVVLVAYEWYWRVPGLPIRSAYRRSLWFAGSGLVFVTLFAAYLAAVGALGDFLYVNSALVEGHMLKGGIPPATFELPDPQYYFVALAPVAALLASIAYGIVTLRLRRVPRTEDWVMGAVAIFLLFYYPKFIGRMDVVHLYQPYSIALPLLLYIVYRLLGAAEATIRARAPGSVTARLSAHPLSIVLVALVFAFNPVHLYDRLANSPDSFRPTVREPVRVARLGYQDVVDVSMFRDLGRVVNANLGPRDRLLDFTNEPGLFLYVLDRDPSTRWFDAVLTLTSKTQEDQIALLHRRPPKLVVFDSTTGIGLPSWDGIPTAVRDYEISRWILARYRPLLTSHGHTFYVRKGEPAPQTAGLSLDQSPITRGIEFQTQRCNWGKIPNFLSGAGMPPPGAASTAASMRGRDGRLTIRPPRGSSWSAYRWLELEAGPAGFGESELSLQDRATAGIVAGHRIDFETTAGSPARYVIPVSSCAQWYGYGSAPLRLTSHSPQDIAAVRLIR